jgi:hypothetical protein
METDKIEAPPHITSGSLFRSIEQLPPDQQVVVFAQSQKERERIMSLSSADRAKAIDVLRAKPVEAVIAPTPEPVAEPVSDPAAKRGK